MYLLEDGERTIFCYVVPRHVLTVCCVAHMCTMNY
jgi:hypothetical protein